MICVHARQSELEKIGASALSHLVLAQVERIENLERRLADVALKDSTVANQNSLVKWPGGNLDEEEPIQRRANHWDS